MLEEMNGTLGFIFSGNTRRYIIQNRYVGVKVSKLVDTTVRNRLEWKWAGRKVIRTDR